MPELSWETIVEQHQPWKLLRRFWGERVKGEEEPRINLLARMCGVKVSSAYKWLEEFGEYGSGRKSDLHRTADQVVRAVLLAEEHELPVIREIAELLIRVYDAALIARQNLRSVIDGNSDAKVFAKLSKVVCARLERKPWSEQRSALVEAQELLKAEIAAGDARERSVSFISIEIEKAS